MKEITTSNYSFESLHSGNTLYVDKTQYVWKLVSSEEKVYFLSRPRRFGKSLLISTLKAYFEGKRNLFKGLAIERLAGDSWDAYPVVHLDMAQVSTRDDYKSAKTALINYVRSVVVRHGLAVNETELPQDMLRRLIEELYDNTGKNVVVLIDEYDKPILDALHKPHINDVVGMMQSFYQVLKSNVEKERFVFITGVSKFAHTSLFSGMNNPTDITQRTEYAAMLGYTEEELRINFAEHIDLTAEKLGMDREALITKMKWWYDGFRFTSDAAYVFNPVSVGKFFQNGGDFLNYWYNTGTPTFLIEQMRNNPFQLDEYTRQWMDPMAFEKADATSIDPFALAVQTGYLTISEVRNDEFGKSFRYDYPNEEIRMSWYNDMMWMATAGQVRLTGERRNLLVAFRDGDIDKMMQRLQWMFAGVTKDHLGKVEEGYYRNLLYMIFAAFGVDVHAEEQVAGGRVDLVLCAYGSAYVFELKVSKTGTDGDIEKLLAEGMEQITRNHYADKYHFDSCRLHVVAMVFEQAHHQLVAWREQNVKK